MTSPNTATQIPVPQAVAPPPPPPYDEPLPAYNADALPPPATQPAAALQARATPGATLSPDSQRSAASSPAAPRGRHQFTPEEHAQMLREFQWEKEHSNDYWGGQKGSAQGPPKDPLKAIRWAARKISRDEDPTRRPVGSPERWYDRSRSEVDWARDGEVAKGDVDTSRLAG